MDKLLRRHLRAPLKKGVKRKYYEKEYLIYTKDEAIASKLNFKPWFEAKESEWGESSDGFVALCLKRRKYSDKHGREYYNLVYPYGQAFWRPHTQYEPKMSYLDHMRTGDFSNVTTKPYWEQKQTKSQYKNFVKIYVHQMLSDSVDFEELGKAFDKEEPMPSVKARALLKKEYIKEMIDKELSEIMKSKGLSEETVLEWITKAAAFAETKKDASNLLKAAKHLGDILHIEADKSPNSVDIEMTQIEGIEKIIDAQVEGVENVSAKDETEAGDYSLDTGKPKIEPDPETFV